MAGVVAFDDEDGAGPHAIQVAGGYGGLGHGVHLVVGDKGLEE